MCSPGTTAKPHENGRARQNKGKRGMDEFAQFLDDHGVRAIRGHTTDCHHAIAGVHFEVKRSERARTYEWLNQATLDASAGVFTKEKIPVVAHRQNRKDWIAMMDLGDLMTILRKARMLPNES
jgi:hypothetical protein